jgi:hypothetical protein
VDSPLAPYFGAGEHKDGQGFMFRDATFGVQEAAAEKRTSLDSRVAKTAELVAESPDDHFLLWHDLEDERRAIAAAVPGTVSVWGSQDLDEREQSIADFSDGKINILSTKPVIAGSGCNFQRYCHRAVFTGIGFKFSDFIQAIHRIHRFLQTEPVRIDIIYSEAEKGIKAQLERKWKQHDELVANMGEIIREHGLAAGAMAAGLTRSAGVRRQEAKGDGYLLANNDSVLETAEMETDSVGLIVTSIPFSTQYEYSPSYNDFGHNEDNGQFWEQMDYLTPELFRVLGPGRVACIQQFHLCPIQFDIVDRLLDRYSMPGEVVYDPFGGIMTVPYCAVKAGRIGRASELNPRYFADGVAYVESAAAEASVPALFDLLDAAPADAEASLPQDPRSRFPQQTTGTVQDQPARAGRTAGDNRKEPPSWDSRRNWPPLRRR